MQINYKVLPDKEYKAILSDACEFVQVKNKKEEEEIGDKVGTLQENIEKSLKEKWQRDDDWYVSWDFNIQYYTCGAIYSERIFSKDYLIQIIKAIDLMDEPEKWAYHTVAEIEVNPNGKTLGESVEWWGEFFIKDKTVYIPQSMKKKYRKMLGCPR